MVEQPIILDGVEALRSLGAPPHAIETAQQLIDEGKEVKLVVSDGQEPASVMLTVDGQPVVNFRKSVSLNVHGEPSEALEADPRLEHAPISQVRDDGTTHLFVGTRQLVQLLLARGVQIPKPESPDDALGCRILLDDKPFDRTIEIIYNTPS